jgi:hypothetical protein
MQYINRFSVFSKKNAEDKMSEFMPEDIEYVF